MKFDNLTPEQQEMFMYSHFNEGDSVDYCLFWVWDWDTLELITEDNLGFISVYRYSSKEELAKVLTDLEVGYQNWLDN